jgi:hypothetical protein
MTIARDRTGFKRVVSPVMADIWKQIIPAIEQKKPELRQLVPLYPSRLDVISVINDHVLDRIKVDDQGVLVVESDASHFTYGRISILVGSGRIIEFVTGGPKSYAYKIARPDKDGNTTICKVRGITLNYKNSLIINFDTIKALS